MSLRLIQVRAADGQRFVAAIDDNGVARKVKDCVSTYQLAQTALNDGTSLEKCVAARLSLIVVSSWLPASHEIPASIQ